MKFQQAFEKAVERRAQELVQEIAKKTIEEAVTKSVQKFIVLAKKEKKKAIIQPLISSGKTKEEIAHRLQMPLATLKLLLT